MEKLQTERQASSTTQKANKDLLLNQISLFQVSEIELVYRPKFKTSERPKVCGSADVNVFYNNWNFNLLEVQEQFKVILLNRANKVLGIYEAKEVWLEQ